MMGIVSLNLVNHQRRGNAHCSGAPFLARVEYMSRGSLHLILLDNAIDLPLTIRRELLIDAAKGMRYLHNCNPPIIHRDLKVCIVFVRCYAKCTDVGENPCRATTSWSTNTGAARWPTLA